MADHEPLDRAIEARAIDLGMSYVQLAERAGISDVSLRNFRKGRGILKPVNLRRLENALEWAPGSLRSILDGGEPTPLSEGGQPPAGEPTADELRQLISETEDELKWLNPKYESNRASLTAHLERRLADLRNRLKALQ